MVRGRRISSRSMSPSHRLITVFTLMFLIMLKNIIVATIRGWTLSLKEALLLAFVDVTFMFLIAWALSREHSVASTMVDGD